MWADSSNNRLATSLRWIPAHASESKRDQEKRGRIRWIPAPCGVDYKADHFQPVETRWIPAHAMGHTGT